MVQDAGTVRVTATRLQEDHSIQKDDHVAEAARTNCIDANLPLDMTSAFPLSSQNAKLG